MKFVKRTGMLAVGAGLVMASQFAVAAMPDSGTVICDADTLQSVCEGAFVPLCETIDEATKPNGDPLDLRTINGLKTKVLDADEKVLAGKLLGEERSAMSKLEDIGDKIDELNGAPKQKISDTSYVAIGSALRDAKGCVMNPPSP